MKKAVEKVSFSKERFEAVLEYDYETIKSLCKAINPSETTIRRAMRVGQINKDYLDPICAYLGFDTGYFMGEEATEPVYAAIVTLLNYRKRLSK